MLRTEAACGGDTAVISVPDTIVNLSAGMVPNITLVAPANPVPVILTLVPPLVGPDRGKTLVTAGGVIVVTGDVVVVVTGGAVT
jgi:hypothetical protein